MKLSDRLHAFVWQSMAANNCNTYLIDGPTRILTDPGHLRLFGHVRDGLSALGLAPEEIGLAPKDIAPDFSPRGVAADADNPLDAKPPGMPK